MVGNLADQIYSGCPIPYEKVYSIGADITEGLNYLHEFGIVHCDLKPQNVLLDAENRAYLCDFGNARFQGHQTRELGGTLAYTAPEMLQKREGRPVWDPAVDVYSFGVVLWEMLHCVVPLLFCPSW